MEKKEIIKRRIKKIKIKLNQDVYDIKTQKNHNFFANKILVHNCSELTLSKKNACILLLLNLYGYVKNPFTKDGYFDFEEFYKDSQIAQRLADNIIDLEIECIDEIINKVKKDPEPEEIKKRELDLWKQIKNAHIKGRRTGTGATALGDTLAACGIKYGSKESIEFAEKIYKTLKLGCYRSSVDMAKELVPFEIWNHDLEKNNPFLLRIKDDDEQLWEDMKKYGRKNIACLTLAPGGSASIETQTTSGIEPLYQISYKRRKKINPNDKNVKVDFVDQNGDCWEEFEVYHPKFKIWSEITGKTKIEESPWYNCCAYDINWQNRIKLQARANQHICHSISSTLNLPEDITVEEVAKIYETAWKEGTKGITIYRKNSRSGILIDNNSNNENIVKKNNAPKRPQILPGEIFHVRVQKEDYFVIIGLLSNDPYEIFAGKNGEISKNLKECLIKKIKRGVYALCDSKNAENILHGDISKYINEEQEAITRLISTSLRHGADVNFVVQQLEKTEGDLLGFSKAICRVLKKYIKDGSRVSGETCPSCGNSDLKRAEGCTSCTCGWTKCL
jgi:ribonucleoside-diphosphate reductase alpha chain